MSTVVAKRVSATVAPADDPGEFDVVLSDDSVDRDGDVLAPDEWQQPLPAQVAFTANHSFDANNIVGSGAPFIDAAGNLRVIGRYAGTPEAQRIRQLVAEGHLTGVSVEFIRHVDADGTRSNELVGGSFVQVPSNPSARVLSSKGAMDMAEFTARLRAVIERRVDPLELVTKAANDSPDGMAMVTAIHDAAVHLGAQCMAPAEPVDRTAEKRARALQLRLKTLSR